MPLPIRVLLVDSEPSLRASLLLVLHPYAVDMAATQEEALTLVDKKQGQYDVALIDNWLAPDRGRALEPLGIGLTSAIRTRYPHIDCILFIVQDEDSGLAALRAGAYRYMTKPIDPEELVILIEQATEYRHLKNLAQEKHVLEALMATQAAAAIEKARLVAELSEQKNYRERLIASSPMGVIAADRAGIITSISERAQKILLYPAEAMLGQPVANLYVDSEEPRRIGRLLYASPAGKLADYLTVIRNQSGESIPIRLAATWLYNAQGEQIGSVGYFEDLRIIQETEQRLDLLLKASNIVAQADSLTGGLQHLAELLVTFLNVSFGGIELLDESEQFLAVEAAHPAPDSMLDWNPRIGDQTAVADWPGLTDFFAHSVPYLMRIDNEQQQSILRDIAQQHQLPQTLQSMLFIPLRTHQRAVGLLFLGELRPWVQAPLAQAKVNLAVAMAEQTTVLIDRIRLHERTERRRRFLAALDESSRHIRAEKEPIKLLQEVVHLATGLVGCTAGGLYIHRPQIGKVERQVTYGLPKVLSEAARAQIENLVKQIARTGQPKVVDPSADPFMPEEMPHLSVLAGVPLNHAGETEAVLFVADSTPGRLFTAFDQEVLDRFAVQAAIALQTSRLMSQEQRMLGKLAIFHKISDYIQAAAEIDKILHVVLTGVTAGYGLAFNRAALFLLDERRENLVGRMGIGHLEESKARSDWTHDELNGLYDFRRYLELLEQGTLPATPIGVQIANLHLPLRVKKTDIFSRVVLERHFMRVRPVEFANLPTPFMQTFEPALPMIVVPLIAYGQVIGLLVADNKFTQAPITNEDIEALLTFTNTAAITIDNLRLRRETEVARQRLHDFYAASNTLISSQDTNQVLKDIVDQARMAANATQVYVILIDESVGQAQNLISAGTHKPFDFRTLFRRDGLAMRVMRTGETLRIEDVAKDHHQIHPSAFWNDVAAAVCVPFSLRGKRIGVMWFQYDKPRHFSDRDLEATQLYANQAAIAYISARRMAELDHMRRAADALAGAAGLSAVLDQIVRSAQEVLQADSAFVWSYDNARDEFILEESLSVGISRQIWEEFQKRSPRHGGTAYTVMQKRWVAVRDVTDRHAYEFLGGSTRNLLERVGIKSFQGVSLTVEGENLGVLYVNYSFPRSFSLEERDIAQTFANHAALAFKKAKFIEQVGKARNAARVVAEATVVEDLHSTMDSVVNRTYEVLGCNIVTLYAYDWQQKKFGFPPAMVGVNFPEQVLELNAVPDDSAAHNILPLDAPHVAENIAIDPFMNGPFAKREKIKSSVGVPLVAKGQKVGVMFVSYRNPHHFNFDELANIRLFAYQAAVAIRNAQLYAGVQKQADILTSLYGGGRAVTSSLDLNEILDRIVDQAAHLTGYQDEHACFANIMLKEGTKATYVAAYPPHALAQVWATLGKEVDLLLGLGVDGRIGIIGRTLKTGQPQLVNDVALDPDYLTASSAIRSELAVPIKVGDEVIGAINVEHANYQAFDQEHQYALEVLAAQAAIAIQNARRYQELKQTKDLVGARTTLALMGMANNIWRHSVEKHALTICEQIKLLRGNLLNLGASADNNRIAERLRMIEQLAGKIRAKPINPPLSDEEGVESLVVNELVQERARQLWVNEPYQAVKLQLALALPHTTTAWASREWLRRAFDILVDNAVDAVAGRAVREIVIGTRLNHGGLEIFVTDTGPGLPEKIRNIIGMKLIEKPEDAKGLGMGLLMAQTIVQTYSGEIRVDPTQSNGTTMIIWLPLEKVEV